MKNMREDSKWVKKTPERIEHARPPHEASRLHPSGARPPPEVFHHELLEYCFTAF